MPSDLKPDGSTRVQIYGSSVSGNRKYKTEFLKLTQFLQAEEVLFEFVDIAADEAAKAYMRGKATNVTSIPLLFCDGEYRGTFEQAAEAVEGFELRDFLGLDDEPVHLDDVSNLTEEQIAKLTEEIDKPPPAAQAAVRPALRSSQILMRSYASESDRPIKLDPTPVETKQGTAATEPTASEPSKDNTENPAQARPQSIYDLDPLLRGAQELHKAASEAADSKPSTQEPTPESHPLQAVQTDAPHDRQSPQRARRPGGSGSRRRAEPSDNRAWRITLGLLTAGGLGSLFYFGRPIDPNDKALMERCDIPADQLAPLTGMWARAKFRMADLRRQFTSPAWDHLLPEPLPEQYQRPYTLLINLDETLIHSSWDVDNGWRVAKRPGVDFFLGYLSKFYEIVIFTTQPSYSAMPIIEKLDPYGYTMYQLYRESTRYEDGKYIKDISNLNRDLSKVIALDSNPEAYCRQPLNLLSVQPWRGDPTDDYLDRLLPFLEFLAMNDVSDVRKVLQSYEGKDVAVEFQKWEDAVKRTLRAQWEEEQEKKKGGLASWLSMASPTGGSAVANEPPVPLFEQNRQALRKAFIEEQETIKEQAEAERQRMMEEQAQQLKEMKLTMWKLITEGVPPPPSANGGPQAS
ncbi:mitochondrial inner membrane protein required for protein import [Dimargaris verticillata]|uniref:Mitochondrial import inner membrane translocase subunit TIM50 n=1 Tax=Dimargaris verticillata TaxID=2761393 RepID=A0A9W8BD00_9FUNG|nr:mitochondrial inner membrane protein required for protein import [Dimargaris verticillata]